MELLGKELIAGGGASSRRYWRGRLADGRQAVLCEGTVKAENAAFLALTDAFASAGLPVALVLWVAPDDMSYMLDDLGDDSLYSLASAGEPVMPMVKQSLALLPRFQTAKGIDFSLCFPVAEMDAQAIAWDLNYFKYCFLTAIGLQVDEPALERDFGRLTEAVTAQPLQGFMMRDFQSRNIMMRREADGSRQPYFIDYQGGRRGPMLYDVASLLWQSRLSLTADERREGFEAYVKALGDMGIKAPEDAWRQLQDAAFLRLLQTLGAYGLRGLIQRKPGFTSPISAAIDNALALSEEYPAIAKALKAAKAKLTPAPEEAGLTIRVASFGFRKSGPPADPTGNGGGFVYDCRSLPNPGRLKEFATQTGRDKAVIDWLDATGAMPPFLHAAEAQVSGAVNNYLSRGFSSLMVSFGCTGGQHRSVYCAEHLADYLRDKYGDKIRVVLTHIEQPQLR